MADNQVLYLPQTLKSLFWTNSTIHEKVTNAPSQPPTEYDGELLGKICPAHLFRLPCQLDECPRLKLCEVSHYPLYNKWFCANKFCSSSSHVSRQ
jgi:hypothetical protein